MQHTMTEYRDTTRTVYVQSSLTPKDLSESASRLRSWAAIIGVPVAGKPVAQISGSSVRVHVPIGEEVMPHPETGIRLGALPSGTVNRTSEMSFTDLPRTASRLLPGSTLEFHSLDGNFFSGDIVAERGALMPASLASHDEPATVPAFTERQASSTEDRRSSALGRLVASFARGRARPAGLPQ